MGVRRERKGKALKGLRRNIDELYLFILLLIVL
jgi:hypothetical protein